MPFSAPAPSFVSRRKPLAACVAAIFALSAPAAMAATTWTVNTCSEANSGSGTTGSLRYAVANAASGDTVDMTGLMCSTISLKTGAIDITQSTLALNGPGIDKLSIGEYLTGRVFSHTGTGGILDIGNLSISHGYYANSTGSAYGGCLYSAGIVLLNHVEIAHCETRTNSGRAAGGAVYARGGLTLKYSILTGNAAIAGAGGQAYGGAAQTAGLFYASYSAISNNKAVGIAGRITGFGGGLNLGGNVTIKSSTVSANISGFNAGGINISGKSPNGLTAFVSNSTISGNTATNLIGGMYVNSGTVTLQNSTIGFNTAGKGRLGTTFPFAYFAPGMTVEASNVGPKVVTLQSSLIANNTYGSVESDLSAGNTSSTNTVTFSGANNLVRVTFANVPSDTIKLSCPLLGPLRNNGGPTDTHALLSRSPGIDQGNNAANLTYDQRKSPYARVSGPAADIGAYEVQQADIIFNNGFDGCPLLE